MMHTLYNNLSDNEQLQYWPKPNKVNLNFGLAGQNNALARHAADVNVLYM